MKIHKEMSRMFMLRKYKAITLIEALVMLFIVLILTVIAIPSFTSISRNFRVSATAEGLFAALQYARTEAIKRNATIYVSFVTGDSWCYGINVGSVCSCNTVNSCGLSTVIAPAAQQISLSTTGLVSNSINFEGTAGAANASGSITFTAYGRSELVTISVGRLGNLQTCSTGITGYQGC
jgi:type IV fimbrial biogenesis protein FimT